MKTIAFTLFVFLLSICVRAQSSTEARKILDKAVQSYEQSSGVTIAFKASTTEKGGVSYNESGTAKFKGNKFMLQMKSIDVWFDGETQWVLMKDANEVNISTPTEQEIAAISPLALLGMYKNGFTLKAPVSKTINGKSVDMIEMQPYGNNKEFKTVSVAVDKKTNTVVEVNLTMKNESKTKIDINSYNPNYKFTDADFVFNKSNYPKAEVIDLR